MSNERNQKRMFMTTEDWLRKTEDPYDKKRSFRSESPYVRTNILRRKIADFLDKKDSIILQVKKKAFQALGFIGYLPDLNISDVYVSEVDKILPPLGQTASPALKKYYRVDGVYDLGYFDANGRRLDITKILYWEVATSDQRRGCWGKTPYWVAKYAQKFHRIVW